MSASNFIKSASPAQESAFAKKRKSCPFKASGITEIDYKDTEKLLQFVTERGKIIPRRISGVSCTAQKKLCTAIKKARHMALLPFVAQD